ncbi:TIGR03620 family F420-dependent LLM class oxidoreductase [Gordonia jinghuaiqii]|uniref:TIGR03620 family F420-dependent LLM class oxidoreductase n=1 Tax=Gordonia jinghuaiqii TaxID=2758710 RepID=A0A7D7LVI5_9ACTN|nr:TIGR03620 family F420-dependent LLM class oxidoreductase [Gordonia jinghuaiqii]MCR5980560.1 TIGR03620 family F420-dependent LLM class oxidoreductase [Gordonia jinghuaiqii]QMT02621.1 TIGR03620 family F420-dependent LLM class oxidoreductase [Gordonia jinghuaiqii]
MPPALPGSVGVFTSLARARRSGLADTARAAEAASFRTLWLADVRGDTASLTEVTTATTELVAATAVLSIWDLAAADLARTWNDPHGRMMLGVGVSHPSMAPAGRYRNPLALLENYLEILEQSSPQPIPCVVGANGPKMLELAGRRAAGAITQLVTPERTARQRAWLGPTAFLATEVKVVTTGDAADRRRLGRANLANYLSLPGYQKNLRAMGFDDRDFADGGSDRLVDALVAGPDPDQITERMTQQRDAGADHLALHVLSDSDAAPVSLWTGLALELPVVTDTPAATDPN